MDIGSGELTEANIIVMEGMRTGQLVPCMFRPKEYSIAKQNRWQPGEVKGQAVPLLEFKGGSSSTLTMELFFDTYEKDEDVRQYTAQVFQLMMIDPLLTDPTTAKGRPPMVTFQWGPVISFRAVISNLTQKFTMFKSDGTPVRASLSVTFQEAMEMGRFPSQNPTSSSKIGYKTRVVKEGEYLDWIAFEEYGDANLWRLIAEVNNIDNPKDLVPGQVIAIVPRS